MTTAATQTIAFESPDLGCFNILEVNNPKVVSNSSTLSVTSGGSLALNYPGADVVGALYLGGTPQPNGPYDSANTNGLITGTGQTADQDHDHDGVPNGVEYFMGITGNGFTSTPSPINGTVTWPKSAAFSGSYAVQTSVDLVEWTDVTEDSAQVTKNVDSVVWTRPTGPGSRFVRLLVTPN